MTKIYFLVKDFGDMDYHSTTVEYVSTNYSTTVEYVSTNLEKVREEKVRLEAVCNDLEHRSDQYWDFINNSEQFNWDEPNFDVIRERFGFTDSDYILGENSYFDIRIMSMDMDSNAQWEMVE